HDGCWFVKTINTDDGAESADENLREVHHDWPVTDDGLSYGNVHCGEHYKLRIIWFRNLVCTVYSYKQRV
ncbi:hypothetical protein C3L33_15818, partial [Rhododendron williamsianum]